jgi:hypothetical protein
VSGSPAQVIGTRGEYVTYLAAYVSGQDDRGNDVTSYRASQVGPCAFVPNAEAEAMIGTRQVTSSDSIYLPAATPVSPLDRIQRQNGEVYEVVGESSPHMSPFTGLTAPLLVKLRRITGATAHLATETT